MHPTKYYVVAAVIYNEIGITACPIENVLQAVGSVFTSCQLNVVLGDALVGGTRSYPYTIMVRLTDTRAKGSYPSRYWLAYSVTADGPGGGGGAQCFGNGKDSLQPQYIDVRSFDTECFQFRLS